MKVTKTFKKPPLFAPAITALQPGLVRAVRYKIGDDGIELSFEPVLAMAIIPDWDSISPDNPDELEEPVEWLYKIKGIGTPDDCESFSFIEDATDLYQISEAERFLGYDIQGSNNPDWMSIAQSNAAQEIEKAKRQET